MERCRRQKIQAIDTWQGKDEQHGGKSLISGDQSFISGHKNVEVTKPKMNDEWETFVDAIADKCMFSSPSRNQTLCSH